MSKTDIRLIFIYNADSGPISLIKDFFHKVLKPSTYECNLCAVSYGNFTMKKDWKNYIKTLDVPVEFLHRDQFLKQYDVNNTKFPSAYLIRDSKIELFITQDEMNKLQSADELIRIVNEKMRDMKETITVSH